MRQLLLIASSALLAACAATPDLPDVSRELRDYQPYEPEEAIELIALDQAPDPVPGRAGLPIVPCTIDGQQTECFAGIEPALCEVDGQPTRCYTGDTGAEALAFVGAEIDALDEFATAAHANTAAARAILQENAALRQERAALLAAGQATEEIAELYREMYLAEVRQANLTRLAAAGAAGLMLLILSAAAL